MISLIAKIREGDKQMAYELEQQLQIVLSKQESMRI
jgi:hypothetical protein